MRLSPVRLLLLLAIFMPSLLCAQTAKDDTDAAASLKRNADAASVDKHGNITELAVGMDYGTDALPMVKLLDSLCSLKKLTVGNCTDESLALISESDTIQDLAIYSHDLTDKGLESLGKLSSLRILHLSCTTNLSPDGLKNIGKLVELRDLTLFTLVASDDTMKELTNCTHIETLRLVEPNITDGGLEHLAKLLNLKTLDLCVVYRLGGFYSGPDREAMWGPKISDAGLKFIGKMEDLEFLALTNTRVNAGLKELTKLKKLHTLILDKTDVTDENMSHVARIHALKDLSLMETEISNKGAAKLLELDKLKRLLLYQTRVTDVTKLKKHVGDVRINLK